MSFPDRSIVLRASVEELWARREADGTRRRRGFEDHLRFIEPQIRYFEALQAFLPRQVRFVEACTVEATVAAITDAVPRASTEQEPVETFDHVVRWLRDHRVA